MDKRNNQLAMLVEAILASPKYKDISTELITSIAAQELPKRRNTKEALKAIKNKLHQVGGAYLDNREHYAEWIDELRAAVHSGNRDNLLSVCTRIMSYHASTRERLPILNEFYLHIFSQLPPVHTILDVACGLHPLALPWMPLQAEVTYYAYDIYYGMIDFLRAWLALLNVQGYTSVCDVLQQCPTQKVDVAFILKAIPCLEQIDKGGGQRLLHTIQADYLIVSFPVHSLGGRSKGMLEHYEARFYETVASTTWTVQKLEFRSELVFLVKK